MAARKNPRLDALEQQVADLTAANVVQARHVHLLITYCVRLARMRREINALLREIAEHNRGSTTGAKPYPGLTALMCLNVHGYFQCTLYLGHRGPCQFTREKVR